jgi:hypothetical protein
MTVPDGEHDLSFSNQTLDLRDLDLPGFRQWLGFQFERWERDPVFNQGCRIRDLRCASPRLRTLEDAYRKASEVDAAGSHFARLAELDQEIANADKAIAGLSAAEAKFPGQEAPLRAKRESFLVARQGWEAERSSLVLASPDRLALIRARDELVRFKAAIGLDQAEAQLQFLQTRGGRRAGGSGKSFERVAEETTRDRIVSMILPPVGDGSAAFQILRQVRLGAAEIELDLVVVRKGESAAELVEVLAVVEAKRNINDVGHGFLRRQANLAWLTGDRSRYEPAARRTRTFPTGHFDCPTTHREGNTTFLFGPTSFRRFVRDPESGFYLDGLFLITRPGSVWGVSASVLGRIAARVASDETWDPADEAKLAALFEWSRSLTGAVETPDVQRLYSTSPARSQQLIVVHTPTG